MKKKMNLFGYTYKIYDIGYKTEMMSKECNAGDPLETPGGLYRGPPSNGGGATVDACSRCYVGSANFIHKTEFWCTTIRRRYVILSGKDVYTVMRCRMFANMHI